MAPPGANAPGAAGGNSTGGEGGDRSADDGDTHLELYVPPAPSLGELGEPVFRHQPFELVWTMPGDGAEDGAATAPDHVVHFEVQESKEDPSFAEPELREVEATARRHIVVKATPGFAGDEERTFHYRVRAVSTDGRSVSEWSEVRSKTIGKHFTPETTFEPYGYQGSAAPFPLGAGAWVIDDDNAHNGHRGYFSATGPGWTTHGECAECGGCFGFNCDYHYVTQSTYDGSESARWTANPNKDGTFEIWVGWRPTTNRDSHVEYFVQSSDQEAEALGPFAVDQYEHHDVDMLNQWVCLGVFHLTGAADDDFVELRWSSAGHTHSEEADVVALRRVDTTTGICLPPS